MIGGLCQFSRGMQPFPFLKWKSPHFLWKIKQQVWHKVERWITGTCGWNFLLLKWKTEIIQPSEPGRKELSNQPGSSVGRITAKGQARERRYCSPKKQDLHTASPSYFLQIKLICYLTKIRKNLTLTKVRSTKAEHSKWDSWNILQPCIEL